MKILKKLLKRERDDWLYDTTQRINEVNPILDRILADNSVDGVIMTNEDGMPVLTNMITARANSYGTHIRRIGTMANQAVKEINPFDDLLVLRIGTKQCEILAVTHEEFSIIVRQRQKYNSDARAHSDLDDVPKMK